MKNFTYRPLGAMTLVVALVLGIEIISSLYIEGVLTTQFKLSGTALEFASIAIEAMAITPIIYFGVFRRAIKKEESLEISQAQFSTIFNQAPLGIALIDSLTGKIIELNPRFAEIAGRTIEEMRKINWMSITHPDDVQKDLGNMALLNAGKISGFKMDKRYIHPDGSIVWISMTVAPLRKEQNVSPRHLCMIDDITLRKHTEEVLSTTNDLLQSVVENAPIRVFWKDAELNYLGCNTAFAKDAGMSKPDELIGKDDFQMGWSSEAELYRADDRRVMDSGIPKLGYEETQTTPDGHVIWISTSKVPLRGADGKTIGLLGIYEDITESKQAEVKLVESSLYSRSLIEASLDPLVTISPDGKITDVNNATITITGAPRESLIGSDFSNYFTEPEKAREGYREVFSKGFVTNYPLSLRHVSGNVTDVLYNASVYRNQKGDVVGVFAAARDITERKMAEKKNKRLSDLYATLSQCNKAIVYSNNKEELFTQVCRAAVEENDFKMAWVGIVDQTSKMIVPVASYGDTSGYLKNIQVSIDENDPHGRGPSGTAVREGEPFWCQDFQNDSRTTPWHEAGARAGWAGSAAIPIYQKGATVGAITLYSGEINAFDESARSLLTEMAGDISYALDIFVDKAGKKVTEQNLEETKVQDEAIMTNLGEGLIAIDNSGRFINMNRKAEEMTGWKEDEVIGKPMIETIHITDESGNEVPREQRPISIALKTKVASSSDSLYLVQKNGGVIPIAVVATPVVLENKLLGAVTIIRDITKEKEIEKTRGDLLALASHQLRTPLSGTKWLIETLQSGIKGPMSKDQKEYLDELYKINQRMTSLVVDMLGVLRMEGGTIPANKSQVLTTTVLDTLLETFTSVAKSKQLTIRIEKDGEHTIETDPLLLRNILESFLSNAMNYSNAGSEVLVSLKKTEGSLRPGRESADSELIFSVKDSGIGIPKDEQKQLFERFYRASNAKIFNTKGTGLGLYIAATLAKKIGATLSFESEEGRGSTFSVHLPTTA